MAFRVLILSPDKSLSPSVSALASNKEFKTATVSEQSAFIQLISEWQPALIVSDCYPLAETLMVRLKDMKLRHHFGLIYIVNSYDLQAELLCFRYSADHFLLRATSPESLYFRARNLCTQWAQQERQLPRPAQQQPRVEILDLTIDPAVEEVLYQGNKVHLTATEFKLLMAILSHPNVIITRDWLRATVWQGRKVSPRSIDAQINKLKRKLPPLEAAIKSAYGRGYIMRRSA